MPVHWTRLAAKLVAAGSVLSVSFVGQARMAQEWKWPLARQSARCEYHPTPSTGTAMVASIAPDSQHLKSDGLGRYFEGSDNVRSYANLSYNLYTYWPESCDEPFPQRIRTLELRLDSPEGNATPLGIIKDHHVMLHAFPVGFPKTRPLHDLKIGESANLGRTLLRFTYRDKIHYLRFGTDSLGIPLPGGYTENLPGVGSTTVTVRRDAEIRWTISAPPGTLGRLSIWGQEPVDLGLYRFSFSITVEEQRLRASGDDNDAVVAAARTRSANNDRRS